MHQIKRSGQEQASGHAGLNCKALLVQSVAHLHRAIQMIAAIDKNEREDEPDKSTDQAGGMTVKHCIGAIWRISRKEPFAQPATNRDYQSN